MNIRDLNKWIEHLEKTDTLVGNYSKSEWLEMAKEYRDLLKKVSRILASLAPYKGAEVKEMALEISTNNGRIILQGYEGSNMGVPNFFREQADRLEVSLRRSPIVLYNSEKIS